MRKILVLTVLFILFQGAAHAYASAAQTKDTMDKIMDSWRGVNIKKVIDHWGKADDEVLTERGHWYYWTSSRYTGNSGSFQPYYYCDMIFKTDAENKVEKWHWRGNTCPEKYEQAKKLVNPYRNPWAPVKAVKPYAKKNAAAAKKTVKNPAVKVIKKTK